MILKTLNNEYIMTIKNNKYNYSIKIGGNDKYDCIEMFVYNNNSIAKLQQINYDIKCNISENLEKSGGTKDMVIAGLYAIKFLFKDKVTHISLDDYSYIKCKDNRTPSLLYYNIAFKRKSWYESNFGAVPRTMKLKQKYLDILNILNNENTMESIEWFEINILRDVKDKIFILQQYMNSKTYTEFFNNIKQDKSLNICIEKYNWIQSLFTLNDLHVPRDWIIDLDQYSSSNFINIIKDGKSINKLFQ